MHNHSPSKRILASVLLFSHFLMSCFNPAVDKRNGYQIRPSTKTALISAENEQVSLVDADQSVLSQEKADALVMPIDTSANELTLQSSNNQPQAMTSQPPLASNKLYSGLPPADTKQTTQSHAPVYKGQSKQQYSPNKTISELKALQIHSYKQETLMIK